MESFIDTKWGISKIAADRALSKKERSARIETLVAEFNENDIDHLELDALTDKVFFLLYKKSAVQLILLLNNESIKRIKRFIDDTFQRFFVYNIAPENSYKDLKKETRKVIFTLVPDHGNIGDLALGYAQKEYFMDQFKEYTPVELPISETYRELKNLKHRISDKDIIVVTGGGDLGTLYLGVERQRRMIIKKFPNNLVLSFPQSAYFSSDSYGRRHLKISQRIYQKNKNLVLMARDKVTFAFLEEHFKRNKVLLTPDIALTLPQPSFDLERDQTTVIFSMRRDKESRFTSNQHKGLKSFFEGQGKHVVYRDTSLGDVHVDIGSERQQELESIWRDFSEASLVVTDRLHGMIFSAITGTPCIAINNRDGKVLNLYSTWLKGYSNIVVTQSIAAADVGSALKTLELEVVKSIGLHKSQDMKGYFNKMDKVVTRRRKV